MNKTQFLAELKAHDWTYRYSDGNEYRLGLANAERLEAIAISNQELKDLMTAYSAFIWNGGDEPTVEVKTVCTYNVKAIMQDAWSISREAAKRFGGSAKAFFAQALKQAWAKIKAYNLCGHHPQHAVKAVYTVCIDEATGRNTRRINQMAVDAYFADYDEAKAAMMLIAGAFSRPFIKTHKPIGA